MKALKVFLFFLFCALIVNPTIFNATKLYASQEKDVILVLDTSLSMLGYSGTGYKATDIFERVKKSIAWYIDKKIEDGDRVTFISFETDVKMFPTVLVDDKNDRDILKKYIGMTEATGQWTNTYKMIGIVLAKADALEKEKTGRQTVIVIMTDGFDDPPPGAAGRFSMANLTKPYEGKDQWWLYLVLFSDLLKDKKMVALMQQWEKELSVVSKKTLLISAGQDSDKAIKKDLMDDIKRREAESRGPWPFIIAAVLIIGGVLAALFFIRRASQLKVSGKLEYWNNAILDPYTLNYDLGKRRLRKITVGSGVSCMLNIRELEVHSPFYIEAVRMGKDIKMAIKPGKGYSVEFVNKPTAEVLEEGDLFKVANFTFKYTK